MFSSQTSTTAALGSRNQLKHNRIFGSTPELFEETRICVCKKRHLLDFLTRHVKGRVGGNEGEEEERKRHQPETMTTLMQDETRKLSPKVAPVLTKTEAPATKPAKPFCPRIYIITKVN
ncbi:hypothetical protein V1477_003762 [Vespula maculifrons]|uniref:Uncharacterized protein n=2 Tax=Vespula TaxID=7451 RepID=A0A834KKH1_VESVU|nr:hypothetical protein HZH66_002978 [Vespula vulgaris]